MDKPTVEQNSTSIRDKIDAGFYRSLMTYYIHQDALLWSRVQWLIALQAGVLTAGFSQRHNWIGPTIMVLGAILTILILFLLLKDQDDRDGNLLVMDKLANALLPDQIRNELILEGKEEPFIRLTTIPPKWRFWARGRYIISGTIIGFCLIDILLACLYLWAKCLFAAE